MRSAPPARSITISTNSSPPSGRTAQVVAATTSRTIGYTRYAHPGEARGAANEAALSKRYTVHLIDSLDGSPANHSVRFELDGEAYVIDLNDRNAAALRELLSRYISAGRCIAGGRLGRKTKQSPAHRRQTKRIRAWASENGYSLTSTGRVPTQIIKLYYAEQPTLR